MACSFDRQLHVRAETGSLTDGMARIRTHIDIDAPTPVVWRAIEHVESHVEWMNDAVAIRLTGRKRHGVGTTFECDTRSDRYASPIAWRSRNGGPAGRWASATSASWSVKVGSRCAGGAVGARGSVGTSD